MAPVAARVDPDLLAGDSPSGPDAGVIKEARRHQRRRRAALAVVIAASVLAVVVALGAGGSGSRSPGSGVPRAFGSARIVTSSQVIAESPYMGVSCPIANSLACDRIGLAVWVSRPAIVTATVAGLALSLDDPTWSIVDQTGSRAVYRYAGFLQPAELTTRMHVIPDSRPSMWFGRHTTSPTVWFRIDFGHGDVVITHEDVPLEAGWG
jgi:hypothetical protein